MTTTPKPTPAPALDRFFTTVRRSPVTRSRQRVLGGVCAGLAERLGVSTAIVRVATVVLALLGPALVIYLAAWLLLPDSEGGIRLERAVRGGEASSIVLLVVTAVAILPDAGMHARLGLWPLVLVGVLGWAIWRSSHRGATSGQSAPTSPQVPAPPAAPAHGPQDSSRWREHRG